MSAFLSALLCRLRRRSPAVPLAAESRLRLVSGHYNRERVAACLWHLRRRPVADRAA